MLYLQYETKAALWYQLTEKCFDMHETAISTKGI